MATASLQDQCERGQEALMRMEYLQAERILAAAEAIAWAARDFDTLSRLYMPLQEARRQRRQRCGEGVIRLDLISKGPDDPLDAKKIVGQIPHGQLLIAGWQTLEPALEARRLQEKHGLFLDIFLAESTEDGILIHPLAHSAKDRTLRVDPARLPDPTYSNVMDLWEHLHEPFLADADRLHDPLTKIEAYRTTIDVDYACELAHQRLSDVAHNLQKRKTGS